MALDLNLVTKLPIINEALLRIGVSQTIQSVTEASREALSASLLWDQAVRDTLRYLPWSLATKYADSADAVAATDPMYLWGGTETAPFNADWYYAYVYPLDCLFARRIVNPLLSNGPSGTVFVGATVQTTVGGTGRSFDPNPIPFRPGRTWDQPDGQNFALIFTNQKNAVLEYTAIAECDCLLGDVLFRDALTWLLASRLAPSLSRSEKAATMAYGMFLTVLNNAEALSSREQQQEPPGEAEWIRGR